MLIDAVRAIYKTNLGIKENEKTLVFTDRPNGIEVVDAHEQFRRERLRVIALLTAEAGRAFTRKLIFSEYPSTLGHGKEPPVEIWSLAFGDKAVKGLTDAGLLRPLLNKDIDDVGISAAEGIIKRQRRSSVSAVIALSNYSTSHTRFRDLLTRVCGTRYASIPLFDFSMLEGAMNVDWKALAKRTRSIAKIINTAQDIELKTRNGTQLSFSKAGRKAYADTGILTKAGSFGNLPAGEAYLAPLEGTANGRLVLEWAPTRELASPVTLIIKKGVVVEVIGDEPFAGYLRSRLNERTENSNIAELGIGTNDKAERPDNILESEKILGTIHIALGDNSSFGGSVRTPFHQDFIFFKPTVVLIGKDGVKTVLMKEGRFDGA